MKLDLSDKKILIVEDEDINFILLELYLSDYNIDITRCIDSEEFLVRFNDSFDLLLLDIRIPGELLGIDLLAYARHSGYTKPIIMQSAYIEYNEEAKILGATRFIEKPFDDKDLKDLVMDYLA